MFETRDILQTIIFGIYVNFQGCTYIFELPIGII